MSAWIYAAILLARAVAGVLLCVCWAVVSMRMRRGRRAP